MALPVNLQAVVDEMDMAGGEMAVYVNRKTGELITLSDEEISCAKGDDVSGFVPEWQKEMVDQAKQVLAGDDFVALPDRFEIHEHSIMERFCFVCDEPVQNALLQAIAGKGAFRRFKDRIVEENVQDDWFAFRDQAYRKIAADFLESQGIPFIDDRKGAARG
jgi:hypothetical protein